MAKQLCLCSQHILDTQDVSYLVPLHGIPTPACTHQCYQRWIDRQATAAELAMREARALRRVPFADDNDYIPEPYAKSAYARYQDI